MSINEHTVRYQDHLWQVWLGDRMLAGQPTELGALHLADFLAHASALREHRSKMLVGEPDEAIEFITLPFGTAETRHPLLGR